MALSRFSTIARMTNGFTVALVAVKDAGFWSMCGSSIKKAVALEASSKA
jgi:hypothetical protein